MTEREAVEQIVEFLSMGDKIIYHIHRQGPFSILAKREVIALAETCNSITKLIESNLEDFHFEYRRRLENAKV